MYDWCELHLQIAQPPSNPWMARCIELMASYEASRFDKMEEAIARYKASSDSLTAAVEKRTNIVAQEL